MVADAAYHGPALKQLPASVTWTTRLPANAVLYALAPPRLPGERGRPCLKGLRLGTPAELAAAATWTPVTVRIYGRSHRTDLAALTCLWYGCLHTRTVRVILARNHAGVLALVTTDLATPATRLIERYAARWSIEQAFADARNILGAGEARNRTRRAVERTVPFALIVSTLVVTWYARHGHPRHDPHRPPPRPALVHNQDRARLRGHAHPAPPHHDRRPNFRGFQRTPHPRANPASAGSLARSSRITAKDQVRDSVQITCPRRSKMPTKWARQLHRGRPNHR